MLWTWLQKCNISDLCGEGTALNPDMVVLTYVIKQNKAHVDPDTCTIKTRESGVGFIIVNILVVTL